VSCVFFSSRNFRKASSTNHMKTGGIGGVEIADTLGPMLNEEASSTIASKNHWQQRYPINLSRSSDLPDATSLSSTQNNALRTDMNTQVTSQNKRQQFFDMLVPWDWINFQYGTYRRDFYVLARSENMLLVGSERYLVSSAFWLPLHELYSECFVPEGVFLHPLHTLAFQGPPIYLGRGKKKWWWNLLPWRDCSCPFTKPSPV
jgi:hypothetical protein